ncbi:MAG: hypothetical protein AUJ57_11515 [Zetaproteobacteria bacterium CG1_02_53_45]|nr:MAG: hypothetical protein AUJ57_11515 [Zetaproteobacteria bacterium CG1_02_53_45]
MKTLRATALIMLIPLVLPGCVAVTAVAAIPGALFEALGNQFIGDEKSYPASMKRSLAAIQSTLWTMKLDVDVIEIQEDGGYGLGFGNERLDGEITLRRQTSELTTVYVKVRGTTREESVEIAITKMIEAKLKEMPKHAKFSTSKYNDLLKSTSAGAVQVGWFRPGARLEVTKTAEPNWLKIKLPSGQTAFLKGVITNAQKKTKRKSILSKAE